MSPDRPAPCHHLPLAPGDVRANDGWGRLFFLPGSDARARRLAERFLDVRHLESPRRHDAYLGHLDVDGAPFEVAALSTGMGCPSLGIVVTELLGLGARLLLRVGTCGTLQRPAVPPGSVLLAAGAVRDEGASDAYAPRGYPAVADPDMLRALETGAREAGHGDRCFRGIVHSKDSLYGRELGDGPRAARNEQAMQELRALGVLGSEMECSHLFVLAAAFSGAPGPLGETATPRRALAGAVLAAVGDAAGFLPPGQAARAETAAVDVAVAGARALARGLRSGL